MDSEVCHVILRSNPMCRSDRNKVYLICPVTSLQFFSPMCFIYSFSSVEMTQTKLTPLFYFCFFFAMWGWLFKQHFPPPLLLFLVKGPLPYFFSTSTTGLSFPWSMFVWTQPQQCFQKNEWKLVKIMLKQWQQKETDTQEEKKLPNCFYSWGWQQMHFLTLESFSRCLYFGLVLKYCHLVGFHNSNHEQ